MPSLRPILLVEDNPNDVELLLTAFRDTNLANDIVHTADGEQALDYLYERGSFSGRKGGVPAVVLLDLNLPKVDGREVLRQIRGDSNLAAIPVVVLTSSREEQDLYESYKLGANAYVVKPLVFQNFVSAVGKLGFFWGLLNDFPGQPPREPSQ